MPEFTRTLTTQNSTHVLAAGFGTILGLSVMLMLIWYSSVAETNQKINVIVNIHNEKTTLLSSMRDIARSRVLSIHRLRLLKDTFEIDQEIAKFGQLEGKLIATRLKFLKLPMDQMEQDLWKKILPLVEIGQHSQKNALELIQQKKYADADHILFDYVIPAQSSVMRQLTAFLELQRKASKEAVKVVTKANEQALFSTTILGTVVTFIGILIAALSIRRTRHAEIVLLRAGKAAHETNRLKSEFIAKMSHELRTPLNAIIGFSEVLEEDALEAGNDLYVKDLKKIQLAGYNLLASINNVLDLSKLEAGKLRLHPQEFSIQQMIEETLSTIGDLAIKNNNTVKMHCENEIGLMYADESRVRQSLFNLLSNACKFSKNGVVTLDVKKETEPGYKECVHIKVTDTGIGIEHEQLKNLFQPFAQLDSSINRSYGGTGLGLVLAKRFCELMGGDLVATSQKDVGSTFTIKLPTNIGTKASN